jgi:hypothetical protein
MAGWNEVLKTLWEENIKKIAQKLAIEFKNEAVQDSKAFLDKAAEDLKRWLQQLANKQITKEEFEFLVKGKRDLAEMLALKQKGVALVKIDAFKNRLISLVVDLAVKTL